MCSVVLLLFAATVSAQNTKSSENKSAAYKFYITKQVENLASLSRKYYTTPEELLKMNPGLSVNHIAEGTKIRVPVVTSEMKKKYRAKEKLLKHAITYTVQKSETLAAIAKKNKTDAKTLMSWNNLSNASLKGGQQLIVGFTKPKYAPKISTSSAPVSGKNSESPNAVTPATDANKILISEEGAGEWIKGVKDDGNFYALHATAPVGSLITVKNMMNNKTITVKVVGKLPATAENEHLIIKLSSSAAKALNILDAKFRVGISYASVH